MRIRYNDYLRIRLGDITAGQVLLTLYSRDGKDLIRRTSVKEGIHLPIEMGEEKYTLSVARLANFLVGDDFAILKISKILPQEQKEIDLLIDAIEQSDLIFIRNGIEYSTGEAAIHIRNKFEAVGPKVSTVDAFIDKVASRSSLSGKPYLVKTPDGRTIKASDWLRRKAKDLEKTRLEQEMQE